MLDIDDTEDRVHGRQELALFHAHYDGRCFLPIHVYEAITGKPVAVILRPGKTPDGAEVALVLRHVIRRIRARWPKVDILVRGDSHYGRPEAMSWCERNRVGYVFGLAGNKVLLRRVAGLAEEAALERVEGEAAKVRRFGEFAYAAKTWNAERRVIARVEASDQGADSRFVVTNLAGTPRWLYEAVYCARGQAENLVKAHKLHLASDRTSCSKATANQFRLVLHTAAYWLLHTLRGLAPKRSFWREAQFDTIRLALIKVVGRVTELATRIKLALPSGYPYRRQPHAARRPGRETALSRGAACPDRARPRNRPAPIIAPPAPRLATSAAVLFRPRHSPRVESRTGAVAWAKLASPRFPSPLIKPDVRVSRIRLSDWLHLEAHGRAPTWTWRSRSTPSSPNTTPSG